MARDARRVVNSAFPCVGCGRCCQFVDLAEETRELDRGDGTCRHFDHDSLRCSIYEARPAICRTDVQYALRYSKLMSWESFVEVNLHACAILQSQSDRPNIGPLVQASDFNLSEDTRP